MVQQVEDPVLSVAAVVWVQSLTWELLHVASAAKKKKRNTLSTELSLLSSLPLSQFFSRIQIRAV